MKRNYVRHNVTLSDRRKALPAHGLEWNHMGQVGNPKIPVRWENLGESELPNGRNELWLESVNAAITPDELESLRRSVNRGTPFGNKTCVNATAKRHGLESTLRPRGRPRKEEADAAK